MKRANKDRKASKLPNEMGRGGSGHTTAKAQDNVGSASIGDGFSLRMPDSTCWWCCW
jgi:hypothetical protein